MTSGATLAVNVAEDFATFPATYESPNPSALEAAEGDINHTEP